MSSHLFQRLENLPKSMQQQVFDFIELLISQSKAVKKNKTKKQLPAFKWQGALKGKYKHTNSVELHHKIWE